MVQCRKMKIYASIPAHYRDAAQDAMALAADGLGPINTDSMFSSCEVGEWMGEWVSE